MFGDSLLRPPIPPGRFNFGTVRARRQRFQPQVNPNLLCSRTDFFFGGFANKIDVPALTRVLTETATLHRAGKCSAVPKAEGVTRIAHRILNDLNPRRLERNPAGRPLPPPAQPAFLELLATGRVLLTHRLHRLRMQAQCLATAGGQLAQVWIGRPALIPAQGVFLRFIAEIPDLIARPRQAVEFSGASRILDSVLEGFDHGGILTEKQALFERRAIPPRPE